MAEGLATATANSLLNAIGRNVSYAVAQLYIQLHTAAPGAAGTTAVASNSTRKSVSFAAAAAGSMANSTAPLWSTVPATETYTHGTLWTAASGGTFVGSGTITDGAVTAGDDWSLPIGDFVLSFAVAS